MLFSWSWRLARAHRTRSCSLTRYVRSLYHSPASGTGLPSELRVSPSRPQWQCSTPNPTRPICHLLSVRKPVTMYFHCNSLTFRTTNLQIPKQPSLWLRRLSPFPSECLLTAYMYLHTRRAQILVAAALFPVVPPRDTLNAQAANLYLWFVLPHHPFFSRR